MTVPQLVALTAALACFASYAWGLARFFWVPREAGGRDTRAIELATAAAMLAHGVALVWFFRYGALRFAAGLALYAAALAIFWWCVRINSDRPLSLAYSKDRPAHLVTRGPYAVVRHPFYVSYILCWLAGTLASGRAALLVTVAAMAWIYHRAALLEEAKFAASPLAESYRAYARRTGRYLPRLPRR